MGAAVAGTTFRPAPSYTTLWDATRRACPTYMKLWDATLALVALVEGLASCLSPASLDCDFERPNSHG
jgi:hypothetical protein